MFPVDRLIVSAAEGQGAGEGCADSEEAPDMKLERRIFPSDHPEEVEQIAHAEHHQQVEAGHKEQVPVSEHGAMIDA